MNDIDRMLAAALDVAPSPDFVARVRQRVVHEPTPLPFWRGWRIAVPALAAAMVVAIGLAMLSWRTPAPPQLLQARSFSQIDLRPQAADAPRAVAVPAPRPSVVPMRAERAWRVVSSEPEVLIPREEIDMYRRLFAAAQTVPHALVVESPKDIVSVRAVSDIAIEPIKIEPLAPPPSGSQGERK